MNRFSVRSFSARGTEMGLLILAAAIVSVMLVALEFSRGAELTTDILWLLGGYIGVFTVAHIALGFLAPHSDQVMLPVVALLNGVGLVMVYRLDLDTDRSLANRQIVWTLVGIVLLIGVLFFLRDHKSLTRYSYILGLIGLILLTLPIAFDIEANKYAKIWIAIGPFTLQPGEFSKILLLLFFAQLLVNKRALFTVAGYRILGMEFPRLRDMGPILAVWFVALLIMAGCNDFGPALLLFATVAGMLFIATGRTSWLVIGGVLAVVGAAVLYSVSSKIQTRVANFLDPLADFENLGYQPSQALFGLSWGGIMGTGIGEGHPYLISVAESDYILAAIGEELGLVGLAALLVLFTIFIVRGLNTAIAVNDSYGKLVAAGLSLTLAIQVFVVTAGVSALAPMTGLTTPFISAGGSSLMANYILVGILLRISNSARTGTRPAAIGPAAIGPAAAPAVAPAAGTARHSRSARRKVKAGE